MRQPPPSSATKATLSDEARCLIRLDGDMTEKRSVAAALAGRGWLAPMGFMAASLPGYLRVAFIGAGLRSGILHLLRNRPASAEEVAAHFGYRADMIEGLRAWLDLGVQLGALGRRRSRYRIRSRALKGLLKPGNDPIAAFFEEFTELEHRLVIETPQRLIGGEWFELADADPELIARTSRAAEPWLARAITDIVPETGPFKLVEVGPGSGVHMRTAARLNPQLRAIGLELQEPAAEQARKNLISWGLADRVRVEVADIRERTGSNDADLVTLHQNIYYFPTDEQAELLRHLGSFLVPGGKLLITTVVRNSGSASAALDLWGAMTRGASRLPSPDELTALLESAGYKDVTCRKLGPDGSYYAAIGSRPDELPG